MVRFNRKKIPGYFFISCLISGFWIATQIFAKYTGNPPPLGLYMTIKSFKIYSPHKILIWLYKYSNSAPLAAQKATQAIFISTLVGFFVVVLSKRNKTKLDTHGTARWGDSEDLEEVELYLKPEKVEKSLRESKILEFYSKRLSKDELYRDGVVLGEDSKGREIIHTGVEHIMLMAPTRSGKGVGVIIPTLLTWKHSTLVNDLKGENYQITRNYREFLGHRCLKFDPTNPYDSCKFNPLLEIKKETMSEYQDTRIIAEIVCFSEKPDHWTESATSFLTGIILHILYSEKNPTLGEVVKFLTSPDMIFEEKMRTIMTYEHSKITTLFKEIYNDVVKLSAEDDEGEKISIEYPKTHPKAARVAGDMLEKADKERASIVSTALTKLGIYQDPIIDRNTSGSDFKVTDLMNDEVPLDLFLVTPPKGIDVTAPLFRLMITQIIYGLTEEMKFDGGTQNKGFKHRLLLLLDEFPALGRIPLIEKALAFIAGFGIKTLLIAQDLGQIRRSYTENNSVLSNCYITVFYTPSSTDDKTPKLISNSLGEKTITYTTESWKGFKYFSDWNHSTSRTGRRLLTESEVVTYSTKKNLILINGMPPFQGNKIRYYENKKYLSRLKLRKKT